MLARQSGAWSRPLMGDRREIDSQPLPDGEWGSFQRLYCTVPYNVRARDCAAAADDDVVVD